MSGRQALRDTRQVLDQARTIRVARMFTAPELERARARDWDPRVAEALGHIRVPTGSRSTSPPDPNCCGTGKTPAAPPPARTRAAPRWSPPPSTSAAPVTPPRSPAPCSSQVHERYLAGPEHGRIPREPLADAWQWATRQRHATTALLQPVAR